MAADQWLVRAVFGLAALSATAWLLKKYAGITVSGTARLATAALFFFVAARIALAVGLISASANLPEAFVLIVEMQSVDFAGSWRCRSWGRE